MKKDLSVLLFYKWKIGWYIEALRIKKRSSIQIVIKKRFIRL